MAPRIVHKRLTRNESHKTKFHDTKTIPEQTRQRNQNCVVMIWFAKFPEVTVQYVWLESQAWIRKQKWKAQKALRNSGNLHFWQQDDLKIGAKVIPPHRDPPLFSISLYWQLKLKSELHFFIFKSINKAGRWWFSHNVESFALVGQDVPVILDPLNLTSH